MRSQLNCQYNLDLFKATIEDTPFGGNVKTYFKDPFSSSLNSRNGFKDVFFSTKSKSRKPISFIKSSFLSGHLFGLTIKEYDSSGTESLNDIIKFS